MDRAGTRILITGAAGFIGSHVLRRLLAERDAVIAALIRPTSDLRRIADVLPRVQLIEGDLRDSAAAERGITDFAPDTILHLAWAGVTNQFRNDPQQIANIDVTVELVRLAQRGGVKHWIGLGSQAEYGPHDGAIREDSPARPTTLYGVTKLCAGLLARHLCEMAKIRFAWLRIFSAYGPMDDLSWMIPYLTIKLLSGERPALTAGRQRWDYVYVDDAADAIARVVRTPTAAGVFNLGSGRIATVRAIAERIRDLVNPAMELGFGEVPYRPDQVMHLQADISKLTTATGWTPRTDLEEGLRRTIAWLRATKADQA